MARSVDQRGEPVCGGHDQRVRTVLDQVGRLLGQNFTLENRPGGEGTIGVATVVRAEPDGYTLLRKHGRHCSLSAERIVPYHAWSSVPVAHNPRL
jgi:tripartite-type tricarboxylate transporter receptor subunit TctC